jgi:hypothetical protein
VREGLPGGGTCVNHKCAEFQRRGVSLRCAVWRNGEVSWRFVKGSDYLGEGCSEGSQSKMIVITDDKDCMFGRKLAVAELTERSIKVTRDKVIPVLSKTLGGEPDSMSRFVGYLYLGFAGHWAAEEGCSCSLTEVGCNKCIAVCANNGSGMFSVTE